MRDWNDIDRTIDFYLRTQRSVLLQCPSCRFILSTQPIYRSGRTILGAAERAGLKAKMPDFKVTGSSLSDPRFEDILMYAYGRIVDEMPAVCAARGPDCIYKDMNEIFPAADSEKHRHFVDDVHLRDTGNEIIASYYASVIVKADAP